MARRSPPPRNTADTPCPLGWSWLFISFLLGLLGGIAIMLWQFPPTAPTLAAAPPTAAFPPIPAPQPTTPPPAAPLPPKFQFYDEPQAPPAPTIPPPVATEPQPVATPVASEIPPGSPMLQAAAFQTLTDAESMARQLVQDGIPAVVQSEKVNNTLIHRVRVGPLTNPASLQAMRERLRQMGLAPIEVRF